MGSKYGEESKIATDKDEKMVSGGLDVGTAAGHLAGFPQAKHQRPLLTNNTGKDSSQSVQARSTTHMALIFLGMVMPVPGPRKALMIQCLSTWTSQHCQNS